MVNNPQSSTLIELREFKEAKFKEAKELLPSTTIEVNDVDSARSIDDRELLSEIDNVVMLGKLVNSKLLTEGLSLIVRFVNDTNPSKSNVEIELFSSIVKEVRLVKLESSRAEIEAFSLKVKDDKLLFSPKIISIREGLELMVNVVNETSEDKSKELTELLLSNLRVSNELKFERS